jgi:hypothetical protein
VTHSPLERQSASFRWVSPAGSRGRASPTSSPPQRHLLRSHIENKRAWPDFPVTYALFRHLLHPEFGAFMLA